MVLMMPNVTKAHIVSTSLRVFVITNVRSKYVEPVLSVNCEMNADT